MLSFTKYGPAAWLPGEGDAPTSLTLGLQPLNTHPEGAHLVSLTTAFDPCLVWNSNTRDVAERSKDNEVWRLN